MRSTYRIPVALSLVVACAVVGLHPSPARAQPVQNGPLPQPLPLLPADNWWNLDVSRAPLDPGSQGFIDYVGGTRGLHPDFGGDANGPDDQDSG